MCLCDSVALSCWAGPQLEPGQGRAPPDGQEQLLGSAATSLGRGSTESQNQPSPAQPQAWLPSACSDPSVHPAGAARWVWRHLQHPAGQRPLQCKYLLPATHLSTFLFYFLSQTPFVLQVLPAPVLPGTPRLWHILGVRVAPLGALGQRGWLQELEWGVPCHGSNLPSLLFCFFFSLGVLIS